MLEIKNHDGVIDCHGITGFLMFRMHIHFYLLDDLLIDTGSSRLGRYSAPFFLKQPIRCAAITHVHEDHAGMASWIKQNLNIPVYLHEKEHKEAATPLHLPLYRNAAWGIRKAFQADTFPANLETENYKLEVIESPGHSPNHVVFLEKNKGWLFTGDLYIGPKQNVSFYTENTLDAIKSMRHLLKLDWDTIFCAHSGIKISGKEKLAIKLDFFESIRSQVEELYNKGISLIDINKRLFPKKDLWEIVSRGEWSSYRMVSTAIPGK
jgi:glyoxylase-like metal-dependent hydrolase (beta-lactamase superfamily II)